MGNQLENIPYPSVIAFVFILVGGCVMTGTLYEAVRRTDSYFRNTFYPVEQFAYAQILSVVISPVTVVLAVVLLTFGCMATGATREKVYKGDRSVGAGRYSAFVLLALSYLTNLCWIALMCALMFPVLGWVMMDKVCTEEWRYWMAIDGEKNNIKFFSYFKFNLTHYGIYKKLNLYRPEMKYNETISRATSFQSFCSNVNTIGPLFLFAWGGCMFVVFGLLCFIGALSANFTKLKYTQDLSQYRVAVREPDPAEVDFLTAGPGLNTYYQ